MAAIDLATLAQYSAFASEPAIVAGLPMDMGGVDPLGLRQVNFALMDQALPGCNNVATRIRPYVFLTWAWWKAARTTEAAGLIEIGDDRLRAFVDRADVAFTASHLHAGRFDGLLGRQVLERFLGGRDEYVFEGPAWDEFRRNRAPNTALMAPVAYGPSIRVGPGLSLLEGFDYGPNALRPTQAAMPAVRAFDATLGPIAQHPLFTSFAPTSVSVETLKSWHEVWATDAPTEDEKRVGREQLLNGHSLGVGRAAALSAIEGVLSRARTPMTVEQMRASLAAESSDNDPSSARETWRALQARQLFRLSLESLLVWVLQTLGSSIQPVGALTEQLSRDLDIDSAMPFAAWLSGAPCRPDGGLANPVALIERSVSERRSESWLKTVLDGLRLSLALAAERPGDVGYRGPRDRLPLEMAVVRASTMANLPLRQGFEMILSEWIIGQHLYWAIGRSGDETQRLRLMLDEGGWTALLTRPGFPNPTPDRLASVLSLMADCGMLERVGEASFALPGTVQEAGGL